METHTKITSGIYSITNKIDGKCYIGRTNNFDIRWYYHKKNLKNGKHNNQHLQRAYNKYGADAFEYTVLEYLPEEQCEQVEQQYLDIIKLLPMFYYNQNYSSKAVTHTEEMKKKMSDVRKGKYTGSKNHFYGKTHSEESLLKMSKPRSIESCQNIKDSMKKVFENGHVEKLKNAWKNTKFKQRHVDNTIYTFVNTVTNEIFEGRQVDFYKKFDLNNSKVCLIIQGKRKSHKNWELKIC